MGDHNSGPAEAVKGVVEDVKGKAKEAAGAVAGRDSGRQSEPDNVRVEQIGGAVHGGQKVPMQAVERGVDRVGPVFGLGDREDDHGRWAVSP